MTKLVSALCLVGVFSIVGCGGDDDGGGADTSSPLAACKSLFSELCSKVYGCFSEAELDAIRSQNLLPIGNNEADCRTKNEQTQCTEQMLKCDSGKTFNSGKANECLSQFKSYSCDEFKKNSDGPAACEATCQ